MRYTIYSAQFLLLSLCSICYSDDFRDDLYNNYNKAVVSILIDYKYKDGKETGCIQGTAFLISSDGYLVTADHLISNIPRRNDNEGTLIPVVSRTIVGKIGEPLTCNVAGRVGNIIPIDVVERNSDLDVAILRLTTKSTSYYLVESFVRSCLTTIKLKNQSKLYSIGFVGDLGPSIDQGYNERAVIPNGGGKETIKMEAEGGESGSPVFDENGLLVGMISQDIPGIDSVAIVVPLTHLGQYLRQYGNFIDCTSAFRTSDLPCTFVIKSLATEKLVNDGSSSGLRTDASIKRDKFTISSDDGYTIQTARWLGVKATNTSKPRMQIAPDGQRAHVSIDTVVLPSYDRQASYINGLFFVLQSESANPNCTQDLIDEQVFQFENSENIWQSR